MREAVAVQVQRQDLRSVVRVVPEVAEQAVMATLLASKEQTGWVVVVVVAGVRACSVVMVVLASSLSATRCEVT